MTFTATTNPKKPEETEAQITSEAVKWRKDSCYYQQVEKEVRGKQGQEKGERT